jgi:hypothetical protein
VSLESHLGWYEVLGGDENLPSVNKTKHPTRGRERYKREGPKLREKEETTNEGGWKEEIINEGRLQEEHEQIK